MKKISLLILLSLAILTVNAQIQRNFGELALGSSMSSVEQYLKSMNISKTEIGLMTDGTYAFDNGMVMGEGGKAIKVSFPDNNLYEYDGENWKYVDIYFYNNKVSKIELAYSFWGEAFEGDQQVAACMEMHKRVARKVDAQYAKFKDKNASVSNPPYRTFTVYVNGQTGLELRYMNFEYEGIETRIILKDIPNDKKVFPEDY